MKVRNVCVIYSNNEEDANSRYITERVADGLRSKGCNIETADVAKLKEPFYSGKKMDKKTSSLFEMMKKADLLVFDAPSYWGTMPAQLKLLFDNLLDIDLSDKKNMPLKGKRAIIVTTTSYTSYVDFWKNDSKNTYKSVMRILKRMGLKRAEFIEFADTNRKQADKASELFQEIEMVIKDVNN